MNERGLRVCFGMVARSRPGVWALALLAYVPSLMSAPGTMPADTKLYLYLSPGRLIADAPYSWDVRQFAGWVPHQTIAYLWPSGPWFWVFDRIGVPDWVAHRLWVGTILFLGGLGIRWAARQLGLTASASIVAAVVYQLSPYVLPYVSRTSVMLLPWASVGWLVGLTIRACGRTRWRDAALFALVVLTVGAVNATAIGLIAPAPILWLVHAVWQRTIPWRTALITAAKLGGLSLLVSLWWIVMLFVQGRHGADVLSFSETLDAVSLTSTSTETLRGLGYWLFYVRDPYAFTTTASIPYMASGVVIATGYALLTVGLAGLALVRWSQRRFAAMLVFAGIVLAVGVHPIADPSLSMGPLKDSALGLAIRSSTRAIPLFNFGIALGAGALVSAVLAAELRPRWPRWLLQAKYVAPAAVCLLAFVNLPALRHGELVDPALERDEDPPTAWTDAAAALDAGSSEYRVMQLPGSEFGAFRWGYTVDPPLPGLTDKPLVTRDLLPLGSPGAMDLLYALDNRFQDGTIDANSIAAVARFLGVDTIWVADDLAFDRFRTPRPELVSALFGGDVEGLGAPIGYGVSAPNSPTIPMVDEQTLSEPSIGAPLPALELVPVEQPQSIVRASDDVVVLAGSGDGVVDAAEAGLLDGTEAVIYAADLTDELRATIPTGSPVIVTDSNRDRAFQWRGSQDVSGFTETGGPEPGISRVDDADQRLTVFTDATTADHQTTASLEGGLSIVASGYGEPFAYRPEDRAAMAVDGDPSTAWVVGDRADPTGETIRVSTTDGELVLLQPQGSVPTRRISHILVQSGDDVAAPVDLTEASWTAPGQRVGVAAGVPVTITIDAISDIADGTDSGPTAVGFAELGPVATEVVHLPSDAWSEVGPDTPLSIVLRREHVRPTNRWRSDPEPTMVRELTMPTSRTFTAAVTLHLDDRASDELIAAWQGVGATAVADRRLTGVPGAAGRSAVDGDPATSWTTPFGQAVGSTLTIPLAAGDVGGFTLVQPIDDLHSPITSIHVRTGSFDGEVVLPAPDAGGRSAVTIAGGPVAGGPVAAGDTMTITITGLDGRTTIDRRFAEQVVLPASIVEIEGLAVATPTPVDLPICREDLVLVDGQPLQLSVSAGDVERLVAGESVDVNLCGGTSLALGAGPHRITTVAGSLTGVDVDRIVLSTPEAEAAADSPAVAAPMVTLARTRTERVATVGACPQGCWLILGEGYNDAWDAKIDGGASLGAPTQISGGFNGWWLPPNSSMRTITMTWTPQSSLNIALLLAALGVLACIVLAAVDRRIRNPLPDVEPPQLARPWAVTCRPATIGAAITLVLGAALVVAPSWVPAATALGAIAIVLRRTGWLAWTGALYAGSLGLIVLRRQHAFHYFVDAGWPGHFEDLHRGGLFVVVLVLAGCLFDGRRGGDVDPAATGDDERPPA